MVGPRGLGGGGSVSVCIWYRASTAVPHKSVSPYMETRGAKRGIGGIVSETCFFFYRGKWPNKLPARSRTGGISGSTWDDTWGGVAMTSPEDFTLVPYCLKSVVFEDIWAHSSNKEEDAEGISDAEEEHPSLDDQGKKDKKEKRAQKDKKGKKEKRAQKDKTQGGQNPRCILHVERPEKLAVAIVASADEPSEPLFHNEYAPSLWFQAIHEWSADGAIIFTPGSGLVGVEAVQQEVKLLLVCLNETHAELVSFFIDMGLARAIQKASAGNRLHDADLVAKLQLDEESEGIDGKKEKDNDGKKEKKDKKRKHKKDKKTDKKKNRDDGPPPKKLKSEDGSAGSSGSGSSNKSSSDSDFL